MVFGIIIAIFVLINVLHIPFLGTLVHSVAKPFTKITSVITTPFRFAHTNFLNKQSLQQENQELRDKISELETRELSYVALEDSYKTLLEEFNRSERQTDDVVATVLYRPPYSPYDTLIIDAGRGIVEEGELVLSSGIPLGYVRDVHAFTSVVELLSMPGRQTSVFISTTTEATLVGEGGGQFSALLPKNVEIEEGDIITLANNPTQAIASIERVLASDADSFQKIYTRLPFNISTLRFVTVSSVPVVAEPVIIDEVYEEDSL